MKYPLIISKDILYNSLSHTWLIILIRFIPLKINWMNDVWKRKENVINQLIMNS